MIIIIIIIYSYSIRWTGSKVYLDRSVRYPIGCIDNTCVYNIIKSFTDPTPLIDIYVIIIIFFFILLYIQIFLFFFFDQRSIACFFLKHLPFTHVAVVSSAFPSFDCVYYAYTLIYKLINTRLH